MTDYSKTSHTVFHHRFHIVWITKYRKRILTGDLRLRIREIIAQVAEEMQIIPFSKNISWKESIHEKQLI